MLGKVILAQLLVVVHLLFSVVPVLGARQRLNAKSIFGCPPTAKVCKCNTVSPVTELPVFTSVRNFVVPMRPTFYVTPAGIEQYQKIAEEDQNMADFIQKGITCEEFSGDVPCPVCESTNGPVGEAELESEGIRDHRCLEGPTQRSAGAEPGICLDPLPEVVRCGTEINGTGKLMASNRWYFRPQALSFPLKFKPNAFCETYKTHETNNKRAWCMWEPTKGVQAKVLEQRASQESWGEKVMTEACLAAVPSSGGLIKNKKYFLSYETDEKTRYMCKYDMKLSKCLDRLHKEHMSGDPVVFSSTTKLTNVKTGHEGDKMISFSVGE